MISARLESLLTDPSLLRTIAGPDRGERTTKTYGVVDPATGDRVAELPVLGIESARRAIDEAHAAQPAWARRTGKERSTVLRRYYDLVMANLDDLATIVTCEMGKPIAEARGEIIYGASFIEWFGEEAKRAYGDVIPSHRADARLVVLKQPVGVVAAITPWNFPCAMVTRKLAPALAAGCAVVLKPAPESPLSAIALAELARRAGLPSGLFGVIAGFDSDGIGREFCSSAKVRKISFTGSTEVGRLIQAQASAGLKRVSLELGGSAPFIVFADADLDAAVEGAVYAKYRNGGQTCVCANRFLVQSEVHDSFVEKFVARVRKIKVGNGLETDTMIGPLIGPKAIAKVMRHVDDAVAKGARVVAGGGPPNGNFLEPIVLVDVHSGMLVAHEETFGPLAPVFRFDTDEDVIALANATEYGLAAYFYTDRLSRAWSVAEALEFGMVGVNTGAISTEVAPLGGIKQSGRGREGSRYGLDDYLDIKYVCLGV